MVSELLLFSQGEPTMRVAPQPFDCHSVSMTPKPFFEKNMSNRECNWYLNQVERYWFTALRNSVLFRRNDRSSRGKAACAHFTASLAKISVTPKPLNESTRNFRQEWITIYSKCMQNFSSNGTFMLAKKIGPFLTHPVHGPLCLTEWAIMPSNSCDIRRVNGHNQVEIRIDVRKMGGRML